MKIFFIAAVGLVAVLSAQVSFAQNKHQVDAAELSETVLKLQKDHYVNLLTKTFEGTKRVIVLHANESQRRTDSKLSKLNSAVSFIAGLGTISSSAYLSALLLYLLVDKNNPNNYEEPSNRDKVLDAGLVVTTGLPAIYSGIQLVRYSMEPYFGNRYAFRVFNHWLSFGNDSSIKLARAIDKNMMRSAQESSPIANLEFVPLEEVEPVLSILTSSSYGYALETVDQI